MSLAMNSFQSREYYVVKGKSFVSFLPPASLPTCCCRIDRVQEVFHPCSKATNERGSSRSVLMAWQAGGAHERDPACRNPGKFVEARS
jgi:hypothetical protein